LPRKPLVGSFWGLFTALVGWLGPMEFSKGGKLSVPSNMRHTFHFLLASLTIEVRRPARTICKKWPTSTRPYAGRVGYTFGAGLVALRRVSVFSLGRSINYPPFSRVPLVWCFFSNSLQPHLEPFGRLFAHGDWQRVELLLRSVRTMCPC